MGLDSPPGRVGDSPPLDAQKSGALRLLLVCAVNHLSGIKATRKEPCGFLFGKWAPPKVPRILRSDFYVCWGSATKTGQKANPLKAEKGRFHQHRRHLQVLRGTLTHLGNTFIGAEHARVPHRIVGRGPARVQ